MKCTSMKTLRRGGTIILFSFFVVMLCLSTPSAAGLLFLELQGYPAIPSDHLSGLTSGPPAAIVILAAGRRNFAPEFSSASGTVDALSLERLRYGAFLAHATGLPVLVSGGLRPVPLANLMANALKQDFGISPRWLETNSRNTAENAIFSSRILHASGIRRILLVTHAWHMRRARAAFVANGMSVTPAPTAFYVRNSDAIWPGLRPSLTTLNMSGYAIHELVGSLWYKLRYGY